MGKVGGLSVGTDQTETLRQENEQLQQEVRELQLETELTALRQENEQIKVHNEDFARQIQLLALENAVLLEATPFPPRFKPPEAADLLNQLKAKRKTSKVTLADCEVILELLLVLASENEEEFDYEKLYQESWEYSRRQEIRVAELTQQLRELEKKAGIRPLT